MTIKFEDRPFFATIARWVNDSSIFSYDDDISKLKYEGIGYQDRWKTQIKLQNGFGAWIKELQTHGAKEMTSKS